MQSREFNVTSYGSLLLLLACFVFPQTNMLKREAKNWSIRERKKKSTKERMGSEKMAVSFPMGLKN